LWLSYIFWELLKKCHPATQNHTHEKREKMMRFGLW